MLRTHGALHSLHFAAQQGMTDEVAAGIVAGQDVNACDQVICVYVCVWVGGWVQLLRHRMVTIVFVCIHSCLCILARALSHLMDLTSIPNTATR